MNLTINQGISSTSDGIVLTICQMGKADKLGLIWEGSGGMRRGIPTMTSGW